MTVIDDRIKDQKDKYFFDIRKILNKNSYLFTQFREATLDEDLNKCFDAIFSFPDIKIPIRIRNYEFQRYMDVTIRSKNRGAFKTEIDKLREGFGDYYFYCWLNKEKNHIDKYIIIDINKFRPIIINEKPCDEKDNLDGTEFYVFTIDRLIKKNCVVIYEVIRQ